MAPSSTARMRALVKVGLKSALQAAAVAGISIALWQAEPRLAMIWAVASSAWFMMRSYGREWRLTAWTCLLPAVSSVACVVIQTAVLPGRFPSYLGPGLFMGLLMGFISGRGHKVFVKPEGVFARKTSAFLLAWALAITATQGFALFDLKELAGLGLAGGLFSTAMVSTLSLVLFSKYRAERHKPGAPPAAPAGPGGPALRAGAASVLLVASIGFAASGLSGQLIISGFPFHVTGESLIEAGVFGNRLPTDAEIDASVRLALPAFSRLDRGPGPADGTVLEVLRDEISDARTMKFHKPGPDPVKASFLLLLVDRTSIVRYSRVQPGFDGYREESGDFSAYFVAFLRQDGPGVYNFHDQHMERYRSAEERDGAIRGWVAKYGLKDGFAAASGTVTPPRRGLNLSDPRAVAALAVSILLMLTSLGINLSTEATRLLHEAIRLGTAAPPTPANLPPLIDPETGQPLVVQDGRYQGGRPGQVWYQGRWMDRDDAQRAIGEWQARYEAERRAWFDGKTSEWERGVREKIEHENMEIDPYTGAWRRPLDPEAGPEAIPPEEGDASRPDLDLGLTGVEVSHKAAEARFAELAGLKERAEERLADARRKYEEALASGDRWLADQLKLRLDRAEANVGAINAAAEGLQARLDRRESARRDFQAGIDNVGIKDVGRELFWLPSDMYEAFANDEMFAETMKGAIAARNKLQDIMDQSEGLYGEHERALDALHDLKLKIDEARASGDKGLEARLRDQAGPIENELRRIQGEINQIHDSKRQWERKASEANLAAYTKATEMTLMGTQTAETAARVNGAIDWYRGRSIPGRTMADDGWTLADKRSLREKDLDAQHFESVDAGGRKVVDWGAADTPEAARQTTLAVLEDYQAKNLMKNAPAHIQQEWTAAVNRYRNEPLFDGMAGECNARGYLVDDHGTMRPVTREDFGTVTSSKTGAPGQDLDIQHARIVDPKTGQAIDFRDLQGVADKTCKDLGFDPVMQEIKVVGGPGGSKHVESMSVKPGSTADTMYSPGHLRRYDGSDGEQAYRVSQVKADDSVHLNDADKLSEACRTSVKDYKRVTQPLMDQREGAAPQAPFNESALKVMEDVGNGQMPPGTGNRVFRDLTGRDLADGCEKLNSMQEGVIKLDPSGPASRQSLIDDLGIGRDPRRAEAYADAVLRGDEPRLPDREVPGAKGWPEELLDRQSWPAAGRSVKEGTLNLTEGEPGGMWPEDELGIPFRSIKPEVWKTDPKFVSEERRWLERDYALGVRKPPSGPLDIDLVAGRKRSPDLEAFAQANPDFKYLDDTIRQAWDEAGCGLEPGSMLKFEEALETRGIKPEKLEQWSKVTVEGVWKPIEGGLPDRSVVLPGGGPSIVKGQGDFGTKVIK